ncbi:glycosyltransferase family 4 protein [Candidatus Roizmanbacteria bacterium]|nr:glycosyltransferase family 4 protein [Candidatus Roizmanbacteria bacterium]
MKLAVVAPIEETVPPTTYGGIEWIVHEIVSAMAKKGHQVTLFAAGDSKTGNAVRLIPTVEKSIRTIPEIAQDPLLRDVTKFITYEQTVEYIQKGDFDLVHNHAGWRFLLYSRFINTPIVTTLHGPLNPPYQQLVFDTFRHTRYISISNNQRKGMPSLPYVATVYNGVDLTNYSFSETNLPERTAPMMFLARFSPEKGGVEAATVATRLNKKLLIAAKVDAVDQRYFRSAQDVVRNNYIQFIGEIDLSRKAELLASARCLIAPIQWEEPFGLMFIEALAAGTPVVAYSRGAAPEIIKDGKTGYLVNQSAQFHRGNFTIDKTGIDGLAEAIERIYSLSDTDYQTMRKECRAHVVQHFTASSMVNAYEHAYRKVLAEKPHFVDK